MDETTGDGLRGGENSALRLQAISNEPQLRAQPGTHTRLVRNRGSIGSKTYSNKRGTDQSQPGTP